MLKKLSSRDHENDVFSILVPEEYENYEELLDHIKIFILENNSICREGYEMDEDDMQILLKHKWCNDKIINIYFALIEKHKNDIYAFSTYFYSNLVEHGLERVKSYAGKENIFNYRYILIPVHQHNHWIFVCVDIPNSNIEYYDSLGGYNKSVVRNIKTYLDYEHRKLDERCKIFFYFKTIKIALQNNSYDCGIFVCVYARYRIEDKFYNISEKMDLYRLKILHEILYDRIIYKVE